MSLEDRQRTTELRALAHPIRLRVLSLLTGSAMTAAEVARELGLTHANASYHLRQLLAAGTIRVAGEERIRGATAKRYRYDVPDDPGSGVKPTGPRTALYDAVAAELRRRARHLRAVPGRTHLTDAELWVDPELWESLKSTVDKVSQTLHRAAQAPRTPGTIPVNATFAMFELETE